ncbi:MAG TPA: MATE family efflux transporter [Clostridiales bacterium]|nr:MATE family efflux transporter [Clostridiales bacterium]HQP68996.1 MATE family efflux transporter [Clostridiales bacterium]
MSTGTLSVKEVNSRIIRMMIPITLEGLLQTTAGFISSAMVGRMDKVALSSQLLGVRIAMIIWAICRGLSMGAAVLVSQAYGAKKYDQMREIIWQLLLSSFLFTVTLSLITTVFAPQLIGILSDRPEIIENGTLYLRIAIWGMPFFGLMIVTNAALQSMSNARMPMIFTTGMNIVNIIVGYTLIFGNFGFPKLGIVGAAIGTLTAYTSAGLAAIIYLLRKNGVLEGYFHYKMLKLKKALLAKIYGLGIPASFESVSWSVASVILSFILLKMGDTVYAAHNLGVTAESVSYTPAFGFSIVSAAFIGQSLGSGNPDNARLFFKQTIKGSIILTSISVFILLVFPAFIMSLLTDKADVIEYGVIYLILMALVQIPQNLSGVIYGALRGAGFVKTTMFIATSGLWGVRVISCFIAYYFFDASIIAIWIIMDLDLIYRFLLCVYFYKKRKIYEQKALV